MDRRDMLKKIGLFSGSAIFSPQLILLLEGCNNRSHDNNLRINEGYSDLVADLAEAIIPTTDIPGAKEAGVGPFIELMLNDCYSTLQQNHFIEGLRQTVILSKELGGEFKNLSQENKEKVLLTLWENSKKEAESNTEVTTKERDVENGIEKTETDRSSEETPIPFFTLLSDLTLLGYFTSEIGATQALDHISIPGRYDGCTPLGVNQKAYAL